MKFVRLHDFANEYLEESNGFREVKNMLEFFFQQRLEEIDRSELAQVIDGFRALLAEHQNRLAMVNQIFFVYFNSSLARR